MSNESVKIEKETLETSDDQQVTPVSAQTTDEIEEIVDELAATPKRERIWEIDFVRGLMILFVVWDHFMWDVRYAVGGNYQTGLFTWLYQLAGRYYSGSLRNVTHDVFVSMFVLTSGVSCSFSRSNGKRALRMISFSVLFSAVTYAIDAILHNGLTIYFNVIHVISLSVLIYACIEWVWSKCTKNWHKNLFGVIFFAVTMTALVVGGCAKAMNTNWTNVLLGQSEWRTAVISKFEKGGDYLPFLPDFGWFLVGVFIGKAAYKQRRSLLPSVDTRYVSPVTFCGKHSLWVYFISQIVMYSFVYLLHDMFNVL